MNKDNNNATTRIKKYEDLREEISKLDSDSTSFKGEKKNKNNYSSTVTVPINNNDSMETKNIEVVPNKKTRNAPIFQSYQKKNIIRIALYALAALIVLAIVVWFIVWMSTKI